MKKDAVKDIKELVEYLLRIRERELIENEENAHLVNSFEGNNFDLEKENESTRQRFDERLITLNNLLKKEERNPAVLDIEEQMKKIQAKKYISVKEMTLIHNMSKTSQQNYRERLYNPLPYHQKVAGGKITYIVEEIEKWLENQHK
jgi:hypothetical protein